MTRLAFGIAGILLCLQASTDATSIVAIRHGNRVVVAADSAVTLGTTHGKYHRCKVQLHGGRMLVALSGDVEFPAKASPAPGVPSLPAFDLHAIVQASVRLKPLGIDVERILEEAHIPWALTVAVTKRSGLKNYESKYGVTREGLHDNGKVAEMLVVTAGKQPTIETISFHFSLPTVGERLSDISFNTRRRPCPQQCYEGDWLTGIGVLEGRRFDGIVLRRGAEGAMQQRQRTPNDPVAIAEAAVRNVAGMGNGEVAPPYHLFEVGQRIRHLTSIAPCQGDTSSDGRRQ
jgi:hypothetical protein